MIAKWINTTTAAVPTVSEFSTTDGQGTPININPNSKIFALINNLVTPLNAMPIAPTRAVLAALTGQSFGDIYYLTEKGREGFFEWTAASIVAPTTVTFVTTDTQQGIYVAPLSDITGASGAWVRIIVDPFFNIKHFGAKGDKITNDSLALSTAIAVANLTTQTGVGYGSPGGRIYAPFGWYRFYSTNLAPTHPIKFKGDGNGVGGGPWTVFEWDDNVDGITFSSAALEGSSVDGILFKGGYSSGVEAASGHAINSLAKISVLNCSFFNWSRHGINFNANGGTGNCNGALVFNNFFQECCCGIYAFSGDANAITCIGNDFEANRQAGAFDSSFLGITWIGNEAASNGCIFTNDGINVPVTVCSYLGNAYFVIFGNEAWASANAPSGTTADNTGWAYWQAGGVNATAGRPAWFAGIKTRAGGSYICTNLNARSQFTGNYHETNQPPAQMAQAAIVEGGMLANNIWRGNGAGTTTGTAIVSSGKLMSNRAITTGAYDGALPGFSAFSPQLGEWGLQTVISWPDAAGNLWRLQSDGIDHIMRYANLGVDTAFTVTGINTTQQFGTGSAVPAAFNPNTLMVGNGIANSRKITNGTAAPTTGAHGRGEIVYNMNAAIGSPAGWMCVAAGTPGTWGAMANLS